jgi:hypothetical protein
MAVEVVYGFHFVVVSGQGTVRKSRAGKPRISLLSVKIDSHLVLCVLWPICARFPETASTARDSGSFASVPEGSGLPEHAHNDREGVDGPYVPRGEFGVGHGPQGDARTQGGPPDEPRYITIHSTQNYTADARSIRKALKNGALRSPKTPYGQPDRLSDLAFHGG